MTDEPENRNQHNDGEERFRIERHEFRSGTTELRIVKETWETERCGEGYWGYADAMVVEDDSALGTLQESLKEWFDD